MTSRTAIPDTRPSHLGASRQDDRPLLAVARAILARPHKSSPAPAVLSYPPTASQTG